MHRPELTSCICLCSHTWTLCHLWVLVTQSGPTLCNPIDYSCQAPLSMGFSRQEYWSGLPFPSLEDLPDPGIEPGSPALQVDSLPSELQGRFHDGIGGPYEEEACTHWGKTIWGHSKKVAGFEPGSELSPGNQSAGPLTLDFSASMTVREKLLLCKPHSLWRLYGSHED